MGRLSRQHAAGDPPTPPPPPYPSSPTDEPPPGSSPLVLSPSKDAGRPPRPPRPSRSAAGSALSDERGRPSSTPRIGLLGGTFDPPHYGHLLAAQEAAWRLGLERVLFLPACQNPLKQSEAPAPAEDRVRMVELAIAGNPLFALSRADLDRPPPSYTVDLLRALRQTTPSDAELFFLAGADVLPELPAWHEPAELLRLARLVVVTRPGAPVPDLAALGRALPAARGRVLALDTPGVAISSTEIRARVHAGQPIRYLTPDSVAAYIEQHALYCDPPLLGRARAHPHPADFT